jgi:hypothetical protein
MDGATVTRSHCSGCPSFVSFRMTNERAMVGCDWGNDVTAWLRREMRSDGQATEGRIEARAAAAAVRRPRVATARPGQPRRAGSSVGFFLAALGIGIALSAWDRPS